jgi:hypothetical protein
MPTNITTNTTIAAPEHALPLHRDPTQNKMSVKIQNTTFKPKVFHDRPLVNFLALQTRESVFAAWLNTAVNRRWNCGNLDTVVASETTAATPRFRATKRSPEIPERPPSAVAVSPLISLCSMYRISSDPGAKSGSDPYRMASEECRAKSKNLTHRQPRVWRPLWVETSSETVVHGDGLLPSAGTEERMIRQTSGRASKFTSRCSPRFQLQAKSRMSPLPWTSATWDTKTACLTL